MASTTLSDLAKTLNIKAETEPWFEALARFHLRQSHLKTVRNHKQATLNVDLTYAGSTDIRKGLLIERAKLSFIRALGHYLWPSHKDQRQHLTLPSAHVNHQKYRSLLLEYQIKLEKWEQGDKSQPKPTKPKKEEPLVFSRDGKMAGHVRNGFRVEHNREPSKEEELLGSKIGKGVKRYMGKLMKMGVVGDV